jgi:hypothetical protein
MYNAAKLGSLNFTSMEKVKRKKIATFEIKVRKDNLSEMIFTCLWLDDKA